jgi:hypothetical protein
VVVWWCGGTLIKSWITLQSWGATPPKNHLQSWVRQASNLYLCCTFGASGVEFMCFCALFARRAGNS